MNGLALLADAVLWPVVILGAGRLVEALPLSALRPEGWLYRLRGWERNGQIYRALGVKRWKARVPDGAAVWQDGFRKKHLAATDPAYLERFVAETCRAELVHWLMLPAWLLFGLWNEPLPMAVMGLAVAIANAPCVIMQRYNRGRLLAVLARRRASCAKQPS